MLAGFGHRREGAAVERWPADGSRSQFALQSCDLLLQVRDAIQERCDLGPPHPRLSAAEQRVNGFDPSSPVRPSLGSVLAHVGRSISAQGYSMVTGYAPSVTIGRTGYVTR